MKLDKEYFDIMIAKLHGVKFWSSHVHSDRISILKQIARDGAEAQKVADSTAVEELIVNDPDGDTIDHNMAINEALAAIESATVEFPHE